MLINEVEVSRKQAYRLVWIVKGHLAANDETAFDSYTGYFKRVWYMEEAYVAEQGFEEAWAELEAHELDIELEKVVCLGGHFD